MSELAAADLAAACNLAGLCSTQVSYCCTTYSTASLQPAASPCPESGSGSECASEYARRSSVTGDWLGIEARQGLEMGPKR